MNAECADAARRRGSWRARQRQRLHAECVAALHGRHYVHNALAMTLGVAPSPQCLGGLLRAAAAPPNAAMRRRANLSRAPRGRRQSRQVRSANLRLRGGLLHHLVFDGRSRGAAYARGAECVGRARAHGLHRLVCRRCVWVREEVDSVRILLQRRVLSSICFQRNTSTQQHFAARENP